MVLHIKRESEGPSKIKDGTYHYTLTDYPEVQEWEWNGILAFISYEKAQGQPLGIICEDKELLALVNKAVNELDGTEYIPPIEEAIEEFVYHATDVNAAQKILTCGKLLSATRVYGKTGEELALERREIGWEDPADFYEYVMFGWGTHLVGDYVVLSEDFPCEEDFLKGNFDAKEEVDLAEYLFACIVPEQFREQIEKCVPQELVAKVHYLSQRGLSLQEWNDKVVEYVSRL